MHRIDLTGAYPKYIDGCIVGVRGEHNAHTLSLRLPELLLGSDYYVIAFDTPKGSVVTDRLELDGDELKCPLWQEITQNERVGLTVEAYSDNRLAKTMYATIMFERAADGSGGSDETGRTIASVVIELEGIVTELNTRTSALEESAHTHANKTLLDGYTQTEIDLADAIDKAHEHENIIPISKFTEDENGNPLYDGEPLGGAGQLIVQTYEDLPVDKPAGTVARTLETSEGLFTGVVTSLQEGDILDAVEISENIAFNGVSSAEEPEGLDLYLEDENYNFVGIMFFMDSFGGNPVFVFDYTFGDYYDETGSTYVYSPEPFTAPEEFGFLEFPAGWSLFDLDTPSVTPVAHSELPDIPNNMMVDGVGEEAGLVYPHLRITSYRAIPAGEYVFNGESWVYQDYAYKAELDSKVDKEEGKGLSENDFSDFYQNVLDKVNIYGDGNSFLANDGKYKALGDGIGKVLYYSNLPPISELGLGNGKLYYVEADEKDKVSGNFYCRGLYISYGGGWYLFSSTPLLCPLEIPISTSDWSEYQGVLRAPVYSNLSVTEGLLYSTITIEPMGIGSLSALASCNIRLYSILGLYGQTFIFEFACDSTPEQKGITEPIKIRVKFTPHSDAYLFF